MLTISQLFIYPVKSLGGIAVNTANVTSRGLQHDRRLMLADSDNRFLTQREYPAMALLQPVLAANGLYIHHKKNQLPPLFIPVQPTGGQPVIATVWDDCCEAQPYDAAVNDWFSQALGLSCQLLYMPETSRRAADKKYAHNSEIVSFADGYPTLLIGQASLDDLNTRLTVPVPMNRFRPNIVFTGGDPFLEDQLAQFSINGIEFSGIKPCARCVMTTIDQDNPATSKEPLKTLAAYRQKENKILFGQNLLHRGEGAIHIGDLIAVTSYQAAAIPW
jgi:uncharacterized protein